MSNLAATAELECQAIKEWGAIELLLQPKEHELGGFSVRRLLPTARRKIVLLSGTLYPAARSE